MNLRHGLSVAGILLYLSGSALPGLRAEAPAVLPGTSALEKIDGLPARIVAQWDQYLLREIESSKADRAKKWQRDYASVEAYARSLRGNRERLERYIGAIDARTTGGAPELVARLDAPSLRAEAPGYSIVAVRWPVFLGVYGEGLLLKPAGEPRGCVVAIPDADQNPEMLVGLSPGVAADSQFPRRLAENGFLVLIPTLLDRRSRWSGDERLDIYTDQSHREWIYRQAGDVGRHPIGYEVQKVRAAIDWLVTAKSANGRRAPIGVAGYGEGGLLALYSAALDERIAATWVSGYFQPRERLWEEPLYRNVWGLLTEFGDAELASLVAPRGLVVEYSEGPNVTHPSPPDPSHKDVRKVAGAGKLRMPEYAAVAAEWERARKFAGKFGGKFQLVAGPGAKSLAFGSAEAAKSFAGLLGKSDLAAPRTEFTRREPVTAADVDARQFRQVRELQEFTQAKLRLAEYERESFFWSKVNPETPAKWNEAVQPFRKIFWDEVLGRFPDASVPPNPRTRLLPQYSDAELSTYEVMLDVYPGVETWGYLILPTDLKTGERRPVVVCQHGAGGQPSSTVDPKQVYRDYARRLARRGFVVYAPFNPNKLLNEKFRQLQRKGNPLKQTVFGIFAANHGRVLEWLKAQPYVDGKRMAFYGLSYGGKTAVRVPTVLDDYCLSICSGDFNDYAQKVTSVRHDKNSFMFVDSYENVQFNLANTFNYAEMAALIAPRPFMVEHGYKDRVAPLEWATAEFAKVQKLYFYLGIPEKTAMAHFDGPHMIDGGETFKFLHRQLAWPEPAAR